MIYLHIPKTGGTSLRNAFMLAQTPVPFVVAPSHAITLLNIETFCIFSIRDPLDRFCSGFWERATNHKRKQINKGVNILFQGGGYQDLAKGEQNIFRDFPTPNHFLTALRQGTADRDEHEFGKTPLNLLLSPLTYWLGKLPTYKKHEVKVKNVYELNSLSRIMHEQGINLPQDPFLKRSRKQFPEINQSYSISKENREWFEQELRADDYKLIEHIRNQSYYIP